MAFADPQTITINAVAGTFNRVDTQGSRSVYRTADGFWTLTISHQKRAGGRSNRMYRVDHTKVAPDVYTSDNTKYTFSAWLSVDAPELGYTVVEQKQVVDGMIAALQASSGLAITKLLGGES